MHKLLPIVLAGFLAACSSPAYRAPEVPVPSSYRVGGTATAAAESRGVAEEIPTSVVQVSTTLATVPFWSD
ncbi:MAG: hypothetical protein QOH22_568, partial [Gemmatimonadaceae bacterium]|nr:hypothetical protein [Gemmatimonadaceae bacterium]